MKNLKHNVFFKLSVILVLVLLLLIPATMVRDLIREREHTLNSAISEVSEKWGDAQTITGPILTIPYDKYIKQIQKKDSSEKIVKVREYLHILPAQLTINGEVQPEKRTRGIYEVVVYDSKLACSGVFDAIDFSSIDIPKQHLHLNQAFVQIGISDLKGIENQLQLNWNNTKALFNPGPNCNDVISNGIHAPIQLENNDSVAYKFAFNLELKGSQDLQFVPVGKTTNVSLSSNWQNPSFIGEFLPDSREVSTEGFKANYTVLHLNRNFPQQFTGSNRSLEYSSFGVNLLLPVDRYQKSMRVAKYAILFIVLTFLVFFFVELLNKQSIHPIQYILVGIALVVFYSLLLAFSEHIAFNLAYWLAALLTISLIGLYVRAVLKNKNVTWLITSVLTLFYLFIFTIIQLQDYALLLGSVGMFSILAVVMYFSRKIDWYNIKFENVSNT